MKTKSIQRRLTDHKSEHQTLTELANKYGTDKGNTCLCAHHYTKHYEKIISRIIEKNMVLLEIGLNIDNSNKIPSLNMWYEYFNSNIELYGFDICKDFMKFNNLNKNVHIIIGVQSDENDLKQLKNIKFNIIIDDGYHASKHQQISFKILWNSIKTGGCYVIEDLHYQPINEYGLKNKRINIGLEKRKKNVF